MEEAVDLVEEGWLTTQQIHELMPDHSVRTVQKRIADQLDAGELEYRKFTIKTRSGLRSVPHYKPKQGANPKP